MQEKVTSWKDKAIADYEKGATFEELAERYGRRPNTIYKAVVERGAVRQVPMDAKKRQRKFSEIHPMSQEHKNLGLRMNMYRTVSRRWNLDQMGAAIASNRIEVRKMELGIHDFTLTQMSRISNLLELPIAELTQPIEAKWLIAR